MLLSFAVVVLQGTANKCTKMLNAGAGIVSAHLMYCFLPLSLQKTIYLMSKNLFGKKFRS